MMKRLLLLLLLPFLALPTLLAQDKVEQEGTLAELFVYQKAITKEREINAGAKVEQIAPATIELFRSRSLAELLADNTAVHIKSLGMGALATASFRGAGASQTRVMWNGIDLTPAMSGIFDFSQMPTFFADRVSLVYGSSDATTGSGAIGGSVRLSTTPMWDGKRALTLSGEYGSYGTYSAMASARYGTGRISGKTRAFVRHSDNNYSYLNKVSSADAYLEQRSDARFTLGSAMQEGHFRLGESSFLSSALWYQQGTRMLPQPLGVETTVHERQGETNLRAYLGLDHRAGKGQAEVKAAYIYYRMRYDRWFDNDYFDPQGNTNLSHTIHLSGQYRYRFSDRLHASTTLTYRHDIARAESYREDVVQVPDGSGYERPELPAPELIHRSTLSWASAVRWQWTDHWLADGRLMMELVDRRKPVVTYSLGMTGTLLPDRLHLRGSVAYNYRFPTLNELYWRPGGNPKVRPEHGFSTDLTLSYRQPIGSHWRIESELSPYLLLIDDWILWLPIDPESGAFTKGGSQNQWLWSPQNKRNVLSSGLEAMAKLSYRQGNWGGSAAFNYSYTDSHSRKSDVRDDGAFLKQIPYVPRQKWHLTLSLDYAKAFLSLTTSYVGVRYVTTDQSYFTYPYNVTQLALGYTWVLRGGITLSPQLRVDNLFNTYYESTQYYPMPRRNLLASILITL